MPDEPIVTEVAPNEPTPTPPIPTTPTPETPQATAEPAKLEGTQSLVDDLEKIIHPPKPEKKDDAKTKKSDKSATTKPVEGEEPPKPDKDEKPKVEPVKEKDPVSLRKRLAEIESEYKGFQLTAKQEREKLAAKIAEYEKRKYLTPEQEQQHAALQKQHDQLQAELYSRDYKESPEFKDKYQKKWNNIYEKAANEVRSIVVETKNPETEEVQRRQATVADFEQVRALGANAVAQQDLAEKLFGKYAGRVLNHINNLSLIEEQASDEIQQHRATYAEKQKQQMEAMQKFGEEFGRTQSTVQSELETKYPEYFGKSEDEESNAAFEKGADFIKTTLEQADTLTIADRATRAAIINRWAASFPRMVYLANKYKTQLEEAQKQIADLRGTDPGSGGESPTPTPTPKEVGTDDLIAEFAKAQ